MCGYKISEFSDGWSARYAVSEETWAVGTGDVPGCGGKALFSFLAFCLSLSGPLVFVCVSTILRQGFPLGPVGAGSFPCVVVDSALF